jgi:small GTP-binding protein
MAAATDEVVLGLHLRSDQFEIENFLANEREKDLLRFSTAGSVDDGKSTLIGRLLYDTQSVYDDQLRSIEGKGSAGAGKLDFALLTDGLRAEREQGITIDVAYRYFATARRKFIIADTPGHEQYTRNMATGASTADVAIVLVDARKGVIQQSRRHAYIASLLGVGHVVVAVNKMDLVGYDQETFAAIQMDFEAFYRTLDEREPYVQHQRSVSYVPVSALEGDNVVRRSSRMDWYEGPSLLELLETLPASSARTDIVPDGGAARHPTGPEPPILCRADRFRSDSQRRRGPGASLGSQVARSRNCNLRWRSRRGVRAHVDLPLA